MRHDDHKCKNIKMAISLFLLGMIKEVLYLKIYNLFVRLPIQRSQYKGVRSK